ncbi:signal peptidase II [Kitasatospora cheerisanensis]|uniref:Lipoprotein signal peptidase n=1 Tax=Kitasatospora cheerisanensis KCTC 2395 TaxID=1348663 RepID=A0A066YRM7_9ACTN|nr:signal peptidase II [Kitasatospora cheerisanensis]KDN80590.1 signal peptidase II [Kitasatospora cheerisanensis KCTC 2395]
MMRLARGSSRLYGVMLILAAVVLLADQLTKLWAVSALSHGERLAVVPPLIHFRLLHNPGAAFSVGVGATWVFTLATAGAVVGILYAARRLASGGWALVLGALLGGAVSHLGDRLFREPGPGRGQVVDFIDYGPFVGNVADIALVCGCAGLVLLSLRFGRPATVPNEESV